ncbi:MAG: hypothetical protein MUP14_02960 [Dehalococcoidia bacterium]|nr:hypothetical protein [Dehalococcoidia bacterium]
MKRDPVLRALLMAEATKGQDARMRAHCRLLPPRGQEHQIRYMLDVDDRNLAELRSIP